MHSTNDVVISQVDSYKRIIFAITMIHKIFLTDLYFFEYRIIQISLVFCDRFLLL